MTRALLIAFLQSFYKAIATVFVVNCLALWVLAQPYGLGAESIASASIFLWFSAQVFALGIALRWGNAQQYLYQVICHDQRSQERSLLLVMFVSVVVLQLLPLLIMLAMTQFLYGNVTLVDVLGFGYLTSLLVYPYLFSALISDWRHWSTGMVFLGCLPLMNLLSNGQLALQVVVWLFSILLLLVYLFSYKRGKRLTIAGLSTFGFYLACIALFAIVTSAKSMLPSVNSGNASAPFNSNLAVFEKPSILPGTDKPFKLDWLTSQIQLLPTFNSNFDELNRSQVGQKWSKLLNTQEAVFTEFETVWREQHRFEVPMVMSEVLPGVEYFLFQTELLQLNLATGNVVSLWKGENNNEIATWYQQVWLTGSTIGGLVWGNNEQVHWLTTAADNTSTDKNYGATVHSIVVGSEPYRVEIDQPAQIALYIYDLQGIGKGFDFVTGQPFSGVAKQIPAPVTNEAKILAIVSPLHANLLAILFNDPLKVRFVMSSLAIGLGLSIGVAIYYRGRSYRWLKAGSVLLLGLPMLLALLAYYPKGNSHS